MISVDTNLLLYAYVRELPEHEAARLWLEATFQSRDRIGIPSVVVLAFLRLTTSRGAFRLASTPEGAVDIVSTWLSRTNVTCVVPGDRHWEIMSRIIRSSDSYGNLTTDAHIAALALEHDATLLTADRDFARFPGLKFTNPLAT